MGVHRTRGEPNEIKENVPTRWSSHCSFHRYGGLSWQPGTAHGKTEFWTLLHSTMASLNSNGTKFVATGASEMARLAKVACNATHGGVAAAAATAAAAANGGAGAGEAAVARPTCASAALTSSPQRDCGYFGINETTCSTTRGCCWNCTPDDKGGCRGFAPSGHTCIRPELPPVPVPSCSRPRKKDAVGPRGASPGTPGGV